MASDFVFDAPSEIRAESWIVEGAFVAFLLLVFVGLTPFESRGPLLAGIDQGVAGSGDVMRQICYLATFSVILLAAIRKYGAKAVTFIPVLLALVLLWCLASSQWAAEPGVTFRRAGLEVVVVLTAMLGVETVGVERALILFRGVLAAVLVVDWVSIPLTPNAIHQPGELDPALVGAWRGLYYHKNIAGSVSAISALIFLYFAVDRKSRIDWLLLAGAIGFTVMTKSKSSLGLLVPAVLLGAVYRVAWKRGLDRSIAAVAAVLLVALVGTLAFLNWDAIARVISDPQEFTGRTAIWQAEAAFIADHPIFGSGYGSFADTGAISPLHRYVSDAWIETEAHGHNGYLQLVVEIGFVGFLLTLLAVIAQPALIFWKRDAIDLPFKAFLFSLFVFMVLHNFMESDFLQGDGTTWVAFLMVIAMLRQARDVSAEAVQ